MQRARGESSPAFGVVACSVVRISGLAHLVPQRFQFARGLLILARNGQRDDGDMRFAVLAEVRLLATFDQLGFVVPTCARD
jgi:hypothetical protein